MDCLDLSAEDVTTRGAFSKYIGGGSEEKCFTQRKYLRVPLSRWKSFKCLFAMSIVITLPTERLTCFMLLLILLTPTTYLMNAPHPNISPVPSHPSQIGVTSRYSIPPCSKVRALCYIKIRVG